MISTSIKNLLTADQAADYLRISKSTLYSYVAKKQIPHYKSKKELRFSPSDLDDFMGDNLSYVGRANKTKGE